eukprot:92326_1
MSEGTKEPLPRTIEDCIARCNEYNCSAWTFKRNESGKPMDSTLPQCFLGKDNLFEISTNHGMNSGTNDSCPAFRSSVATVSTYFKNGLMSEGTKEPLPRTIEDCIARCNEYNCSAWTFKRNESGKPMDSTLPQCFLGKDNLFEISTNHGMNSGTNDSCPVCRGTPRVGGVVSVDHCKVAKVGDSCDL